MHAYEDVVGPGEVEDGERLADDLLVHLVGKYASRVRPLICQSPVPGTIRTRAMACLRRPVAAPGAEALGRRSASPATGAVDSEV